MERLIVDDRKLHELDPLSHPFLPDYLQRVCRRCHVDRADLFRYDPDRRLLQGILGVCEGEELESITDQLYPCPPGTSGDILREVATGGVPYRLTDRSAEIPHWRFGADGLSCAAVPIPVEGRIIGVLAVATRLIHRRIETEEIPEIARMGSEAGPYLEGFHTTQPADLMEGIIDSLDEGICLILTGGWILHANPALEAIYGYDRWGTLWLTFDELFRACDKAQREERKFAELSGRSGDWIEERINRRQDGTLFPARLHLIDLHERTRIRCWAAVVRDLRAGRGLDEAEQRKAELEGALMAIRALQHEVNNPLQALQMTLEMLAQKPLSVEDPRYQARLDRLWEAAERIGSVIQRMSTLNRIETVSSPAGSMIRIPGSRRDSLVE